MFSGLSSFFIICLIDIASGTQVLFMMAQNWTSILYVCIYLLSRYYCLCSSICHARRDCNENWRYYSDMTGCSPGGVCKLCPMNGRHIKEECKRKHSNDYKYPNPRWCTGGIIPTCDADPKIPNGEVECNGPINNLYRNPVPMYPDTVCSFSCHPGYTLIGSKSVVCLDECYDELRLNTTFPFCKGAETHTSTEMPVFLDSSVSPSMEQKANVVLENNETLDMKPKTTEVSQGDTRYAILPGHAMKVIPQEPDDSMPVIIGVVTAAVVVVVAVVVAVIILSLVYKGKILRSSLHTKVTCCGKANSENRRRTPVESADYYTNPDSVQSTMTPLSSEEELPPRTVTNRNRLPPRNITNGNILASRTNGSAVDTQVGYPETIDKSYQSNHFYISLQGGQSSSALLMSGQPTTAPPVDGQLLHSDYLMDEQELQTDTINASRNPKPCVVDDESVKMWSQTHSILAKDCLSADGMSEPPTAVGCLPSNDKVTVL